jgi:hypothetical protein
MTAAPQKQALPAAVYEATDPRAAGAARVVPPDAALAKVGNAVLGYTKAPATSAKRTPFSTLQMQGRHLRKVLRALVRIRISKAMTVLNVESACLWIGFEPDRATVATSTARAALARRSDTFKLMPGAVIGAMVNFRAEERRQIAGMLRLKRIAISSASTKRRLKADTALELRASRGALPREQSKARTQPWKTLGLSRTEYYARGLHRSPDDFVGVTHYKGKSYEIVQNAGKSYEIVRKIEPDTGRDEAPIGKSYEFVQEAGKDV